MIYNETRKNPLLSIFALLLSIGSIMLFIYPETIAYAKVIGPLFFFIGLVLSVVSLKQSSKVMAYLSFFCLFIMLSMVTKSVVTIYSPVDEAIEHIANIK
ncbi:MULTISPECIES: hypothetical protein [Myroides]|uniref:Uncharacterized protein n=1 Tax=Myroides albus TaxID=2562892 RepID=A0A6I3LI91_9FLAO|nr:MULTISPECIES: hypothetical protein [Myroides]MTG97514.1 hypothetical protein [Myroides albus]MVX35468.1 hypothetical protein [Myroides sp. LoEW2-1]UVD81209.1 hypothetical protein NWE55_08220 [Myroides albus]